MTGFIIFIHVIVCILLTTAVLMQSGRGGGLTESFASAESMFGAQTNEFMIKTTSVLATVFIVTCLGLAVLSAKKEQSLLSSVSIEKTKDAAPDVAPQPQAAQTETNP